MWGRRDTRMTGIHCCILEVSSIVMEPWKPLRCNILCRAVGRLFAIQWKSHQSLPHTGVSPWLPSTHSKFRNLSLGHCLSEDVSSLSWVSLIFPLYSLLLPVLSPNNSPSTLLSEILVLREILDIGQNAFFPLQVQLPLPVTGLAVNAYNTPQLLPFWLRGISLPRLLR